MNGANPPSDEDRAAEIHAAVDVLNAAIVTAERAGMFVEADVVKTQSARSTGTFKTPTIIVGRITREIG